MNKREFIALLGGAAAWPLAAPAQQAGKLPTVGFLVPNTRSAAAEWVDAFLVRLRELGWIEGRTVAIEYRWVEDTPSASTKSQPNSPSSMSTSSSRRGLRPSWHYKRRQVRSPSYLRQQATQSGLVWLPVWRDPVVIRLDLQLSGTILPGNGSKFCAKWLAFAPFCPHGECQ